MSSSTDIILTLFAHGMIIGRDNKASANSLNIILAACTTEGCTNPNCKAKKCSTHTTANCYWPGGGKEGQFPANFGQKNRANAVTSGSTTSQPEHFVLSAIIPDTPSRSGISIDDLPSLSPIVLISQGFQKFQNIKYLHLWILVQAIQCLYHGMYSWITNWLLLKRVIQPKLRMGALRLW